MLETLKDVNDIVLHFKISNCEFMIEVDFISYCQEKNFGQICQMDTLDYVFYTQQYNNNGLISKEVF